MRHLILRTTIHEAYEPLLLAAKGDVTDTPPPSLTRASHGSSQASDGARHTPSGNNRAVIPAYLSRN